MMHTRLQLGGKRTLRTSLVAGSVLMIAGGAQAADPLVKACSPTDNFVIGFSQANNAEPYRQHVNDELTAEARKSRISRCRSPTAPGA